MLTQIWRVLKRVFAYIGLMIAVVVLSGVAFRAYRQYRIAGQTHIDTSKGIAEEGFVSIGDIDQWVSIRGVDRNNPVLLLLHGGPGITTSANPRTILHGWERQFTLVQWDQRGAGRTFGRSGPVGSDATIDTMVRDGLAVAEYARTKLQRQKVILLGFSWGAILGVHMIKARPDLFWAYVGTGQLSNYQRDRKLAYNQLVSEARARNEREALTELAAIGPPPYTSTADAAVHTKWANYFEPGGSSGWEMARNVLFESPLSLLQVRDYMRGLTSSQDHFRRLVNEVDLDSLGPEFTIPVFVFNGSQDNVAPTTSAESYLQSIRAPRKLFVPIDYAGHTAIFTKTETFLALLTQHVRPLAVDR